MASLDRTLRRDLENAVKKARRVAETGAGKALEALAVHRHEPWGNLIIEERALRNRLRAHGRQLGDERDKTQGTQSITRLTGECAYEHWHRMLFARYLAENELLIHPEHDIDISLDDCQKLARELGQDWLELASSYAVRMLPEIFRTDDPVLEISLPPETRSALEDLLKALPSDIFTASDSLGWCYQFWQADRKKEVNDSGEKIGADELPAVTQLFTEAYMVDFLLDNTLGAWYAGRIFAANPALAETAQSEEELRNAMVLPGCSWKYLRFIKAEDGRWTPAAGTFDGWPKTAKELTCLDPCMGSGHFVVAMFERLVALRLAEETLNETAAVEAVIRDNLFGLEIDPRCTQIGAFNLALAAWRRVGHCTLPPMNLACSGLAPNTREADWLAIAGSDEKVRNGMARLYRLFKDAPVLGSLIDPRAGEGDLLVAEFHELQPLLEKATEQESDDEDARELAVTARGLAKTIQILAVHFVLVATNVPYLGRGNQDDLLQDYCARLHPEAKGELATCFVERSLNFCRVGGTAALVTPQTWVQLGTYKNLRKNLLKETLFGIVSRLGAGAFETITGEVVNVLLITLSRKKATLTHSFHGLDVSAGERPTDKSLALQTIEGERVVQIRQLENPGAIITVETVEQGKLLSDYAGSHQGVCTNDYTRFGKVFWEIPRLLAGWDFQQSPPDKMEAFRGRQNILWISQLEREEKIVSAYIRGRNVWSRTGVAVAQMDNLYVSIYSGHPTTDTMAIIMPRDPHWLVPIWAFCSSQQYRPEVRKLFTKVNLNSGYLNKVPFNLSHWQKVAAEKYPDGLPTPFSSDPTQWLFNGHPKASEQPLQVAVTRLLGYQWPRQTGSSFPDCPALGPDGLEELADDDGIVCLLPVNRERPAATRLRVLLATAFGSEWSAGKERELLIASGSKRTTLEDWLVDEFFEQHCNIFHQRPFVWHLWDGLRDGFNALVNYHRLAAPNGEGHRLLEKLIYTYLGDWITRQRQDQQNGVEGADARIVAALHLQEELKKILAGEPPYDLFVRWKSLRQQAISWEPDINDGVRMNIRPFMTARPLNAKAKNACILRVPPKSIKWEKDRGKEPNRAKEDFPWFWGWDEKTQDFAGGKTFDGVRWNDLHYTNKTKQEAREKKGGHHV